MPLKHLLSNMFTASDVTAVQSEICFPWMNPLCCGEMIFEATKEKSLEAKVFVIILNWKFAKAIGLKCSILSA